MYMFGRIVETRKPEVWNGLPGMICRQAARGLVIFPCSEGYKAGFISCAAVGSQIPIFGKRRYEGIPVLFPRQERVDSAAGRSHKGTEAACGFLMYPHRQSSPETLQMLPLLTGKRPSPVRTYRWL